MSKNGQAEKEADEAKAAIQPRSGWTTRVRPNRHAFTLAALLLAMWYAAGAQSHGAIYLLAYGLAALALVSWLHARANLRGLDLRAGELVRSRSQDIYRVPFTLQAAAARPPCGIEVSAAGARSPVFVDEVKAGQVFRSEISLPASALADRAPVTLVARSLYPLGFFTAEMRVTASHGMSIPPAAAGDLPLPAVITAAPKKTPAVSRPGIGSSGTGDDFAGTRAWQPGDSPRHIDWKAVARDRPLMTKQWAGDRVSFVPIDWAEVDLPDDQKPGQIVQWMRQCEANSLAFSLRLPDAVIEPGIGPEHSAKCLDALAAMQQPVLKSSGTKASWKRLPFAHETAPSLAGRPLLVICLALLLALPPLAGDVSLIAMVFMLVAVGMRLAGWSRKVPPSANLFLIILGAHLVAITAVDLRGMETATAMLLIFLGGKVAESRSPRDFQVLAILAVFLCMCGLSFEPGLGWSLWAFGVFMLVIIALARFRRGASGLRGPARTAAAMLVQAAPIAAVLFVLFPRCPEGLVGQLIRRNQSQSGLATSLRPGGIAGVAHSSQAAFRARFTGGKTPDSDERYWRCIVLWECGGLAWEKGGFNPARRGPVPSRGEIIEQEITLEPSGLQWLPVLDRPLAISGAHAESFITAEHSAWTREPSDNPQKYLASSTADPPFEPLSRMMRFAALQPPKNISPRVKGLANQLRDLAAEDAEGGDEAAVEGALDFFRGSGFRYTVQPGAYTSGDDLDEFLFERRLGFCEHFAASFATLMRLADVPSRVVLGYLGGEYSERGDYWIVRQSDAHAWAEVWLEEKGWVRIDPTAELAPGRVTGGLAGALSGDLGFFAGQRNTWWWRAAMEARLVWDHLNYEWLNRVIDADEEAHRLGLQSLNLDGERVLQIVWLAAGLMLAGGVIAVWLRRKPRHPDLAARLWQKFCERLAKRGVARQPHEGAEAFASRAAAQLPHFASGILAVASLYNEARYGGKTSRLGELRNAVRRLG